MVATTVVLASAAMRRLSLVFVAFAACVGAGRSVFVTPLNPSPRPFTPRKPSAVEMYTTARPERPYIEVATLESPDINDIRYKAGDIGCDAVLVTRMGTMQVDTVATCVVWKDVPPPAAGNELLPPPTGQP